MGILFTLSILATYPSAVGCIFWGLWILVHSRRYSAGSAPAGQLLKDSREAVGLMPFLLEQVFRVKHRGLGRLRIPVPSLRTSILLYFSLIATRMLLSLLVWLLRIPEVGSAGGFSGAGEALQVGWAILSQLFTEMPLLGPRLLWMFVLPVLLALVISTGKSVAISSWLLKKRTFFRAFLVITVDLVLSMITLIAVWMLYDLEESWEFVALWSGGALSYWGVVDGVLWSGIVCGLLGTSMLWSCWLGMLSLWPFLRFGGQRFGRVRQAFESAPIRTLAVAQLITGVVIVLLLVAFDVLDPALITDP